jgi:urease accessory protein
MQNKRSVSFNHKLALAGLSSLSLLLWGTPALAHHPFGGDVPANAFEGFLSGLGHPVIGFDHLAFVITAGLLAVEFKRGLLIPVAFVATSLIGTPVHLLGVNLPAPEFLISASVLLFGVLLAKKNYLPVGAVAALAAAAGLFHGYAYGEVVVGAGMSPVLAYLAGFSTIQMGIAVGAYFVAKKLGANSEQKSLSMQFAGFTLAGIGTAFLSSVMLG